MTPVKYTLRDSSADCLTMVPLEAATLAAAITEAEQLQRDAYQDESTTWVDYEMFAGDHAAATEYPDDESVHSGTVTVHPSEPQCDSEEGHDWTATHEIEGGLEENPGVFGHNGGVTISEHCTRCDWHKETDTWAQRRDTGEQGHTSIKYGRREEPEGAVVF